MRRNVWVVLGVLAIGVGLALAIPAVSNLGEQTTTETFDEVTDLVFDLQNGSVSFVGGHSETVVETKVTTGPFGGEVTIDQSEGTLRIKQSCPLVIGWGCRAFVNVTLPSDVEVSGSTSNGTVTAEVLDEPISLTTSNGPINVVNLSGPAVFRSSNGDVLAMELGSTEVEASTSNGRVQLEFAAAPDTVRATSSNGTVVVILPADAPAYDVETSTSNGRTSTDIRTDPGATGSILAETSNGDIIIRYDE